MKKNIKKIFVVNGKKRINSCTFNQSGRSMIEMLGVLAIIGVLSVGGIAGYSKAMTKNKINKVVDNVSMIVTNIRTLYAQQTDYANLDNNSAVQMGAVPNEMIGNGNDAYRQRIISHAFLGNVFIRGAKSGNSGFPDKAFVINLNGLPKEACMALATYDWGSDYSSGLIGFAAYGWDSTRVLFSHELTEDGDLLQNCTGKYKKFGDADRVFACAGDSGLYGVPLNVAEAAKGCNCGKRNNCGFTLKYN